ncbi:MAG: TraB/GumN family protein [Oscillospiraceae bacterium]|nr:TraB/GumN family protein [Oscillospiraceae bacterium]
MLTGIIKRFSSVLLCVCILTGCTGGGSSAAETVEITPPFWTVTDKESGATLFLLGSMHVGQEGVVYPDYILRAYEQCDTVAAEIDTAALNENTDIINEAAQYLLLPEGVTAQACFGDSYDETVDFMSAKGLYSKALDRYIPYYWSSVLSVEAAQECGLSSEYGTEEYFLSMAHEDGKTICEIESVAQQYQMMAEIPMAVQVLSVTECVGDENYDTAVSETKQLYDMWSCFDEERLGGLDYSVYEDIPSDVYSDHLKFLDMMYLGRQEKMAEAAVEFLQGGEDVFMLVGAAHFYIEDDILTLLERAGYVPVPVRVDADVQAA